jgi:hypothetical protein
MRRGVVLVALVGGFVGATTLPAAAQYWEDNAVGLNIGFGPPVYSAPLYGAPVYGAYEADYYAAPPAAYAYSAPAASYGYGAYGYAGPYVGVSGYAGPYAAGPGYWYGSGYAYEPDYTYNSGSSVTVSRGYRDARETRPDRREHMVVMRPSAAACANAAQAYGRARTFDRPPQFARAPVRRTRAPVRTRPLEAAKRWDARRPTGPEVSFAAERTCSPAARADSPAK